MDFSYITQLAELAIQKHEELKNSGVFEQADRAVKEAANINLSNVIEKFTLFNENMIQEEVFRLNSFMINSNIGENIINDAQLFYENFSKIDESVLLKFQDELWNSKEEVKTTSFKSVAKDLKKDIENKDFLIDKDSNEIEELIEDTIEKTELPSNADDEMKQQLALIIEKLNQILELIQANCTEENVRKGFLVMTFIWFLTSLGDIGKSVTASFAFEAIKEVRTTIKTRYYVIADVLNVRSKPSDKGFIQDKLSQGTVVYILDENEEGSWVKVQYTKNGVPPKEIIGWISRKFIQPYLEK